MKTTRQTFVWGALSVCTTGLLSAACGGDDDDDSSGTGCGTSIAMNHGHQMSVSAADQMAAADKTYNIAGSANHSHTVELTAEDFADLAGGTIVSVTSSTDAGHSHDVTITC
ncbi:MAG TPA: hypothetical protein VJN18_25200 [Polyangiaceae bacterium]|nr:hypothetical protein [Polyangiaceae bacterium]